MIKITTITGKSSKNTIKQQVTKSYLHIQGKQVFKNEVKLQNVFFIIQNNKKITRQ